MSYLNSFGMFGRGRPVVCDTACTEAEFVFLLTERLKFRNIVGGSSGIRPISERVALGVFRQYMAVQYRQSLCFPRRDIRLIGFVVQYRKLIVILAVKHGVDRLPGDHQGNGISLAEIKIALLRVIKRVIIGCCRHAVQHYGIVAAGIKGGAVFL
ncbi:unknown [Clostridium sp. CAG:448]|nr:unknown [Clostridium sp. CAG:448]